METKMMEPRSLHRQTTRWTRYRYQIRAGTQRRSTYQTIRRSRTRCLFMCKCSFSVVKTSAPAQNLQHPPYGSPAQVYPAAPPHDPSGDTFEVLLGLGLATDDCIDDTVTVGVMVTVTRGGAGHVGGTVTVRVAALTVNEYRRGTKASLSREALL